MNSKVKAGKTYIERGWSVLRLHYFRPGSRVCSCENTVTPTKCGSPAKHPSTRHGVKDATKDTQQMVNWWAQTGEKYNMGIATGETSGIVVIDIDPRHNGDVSLAKLEQEYGKEWMDTVVCMTGGGGYHLYFQYPEGIKVGNKANLYQGIDVRGNGGYVVAPPSLHESGIVYSWHKDHHPATHSILPLPEWLLNRIQSPGRRDSESHERMGGGNEEGTRGSESGRIDSGARNDSLASLAGTMRRRGMSVEEIDAALQVVNTERCKPPLPWREVRLISESVGSYVPGDEPERQVDALRFPLTDTGNAELFVDLFGDSVRYDHSRGRWLIWKDHRWACDDMASIRLRAIEVARWRYNKAVGVPDKKLKDLTQKFARQSENRNKVENMLHFAKAHGPIATHGEGWDSDPFLLGVEDGVIDLRTGELRDGQPSDNISRFTKIKYREKGDCPRWKKFLEEIFNGDKEIIRFVQRAIGYSITGKTDEQCLFMCFGTGSNGKSVFLNTLRRLGGLYAYNIPFSTLEQAGKQGVPNDVASLDGKRIILASETSEASRLNEARIKALTGGDTITARFLHAEFFEFTPVCKFWLATNHRPSVGDDSFGFWRRVKLIPFNRTFTKTEADPDLEAKLSQEMPGILSWAIDGCREWQERGLGYAQVVEEATEEYRRDSDVIGQFIRECITEIPGVELPATNVYDTYRGWCRRRGVAYKDILKGPAFAKRLAEKYTLEGDAQTGSYQGLKLKPEANAFLF